MKISDYLSLMNRNLGHLTMNHYKKNLKCKISSLCDIYGSDKGSLTEDNHFYSWPAHTYADYYSKLFSHCNNYIHHVFECGLGTNKLNMPSSMGLKGKPGASLRVWRDFFPNATIIGADIDSDILFEEDRIKTFYVDQTSVESISNLWLKIPGKFDIMIDDGLHTFHAGRILFENSVQKLSDNGIYIIEDVTPQSLIEFKSYFSTSDYVVEYVNLFRPGVKVISDNNLIAIRKF